jgi:hypothetical protein
VAALVKQSPEDRAVAGTEAPEKDAFTGEVLETMDASGYTYLRLDTSGGPVWAAVERSPVKTGATVTIVVSVALDGFESRTLGRRFDRIVFGTLEPRGDARAHSPVGPRATAADRPPAMASALAGPHATAAPEPADLGPLKVSKAPGPDGRTVSEVFAQGAALDTRPVAVRGKVVKFLPGIIGRNWLHLQDGTGSPEGNDHDLTVTTAETAAVGDVVLVRGTVRKDLDFGAGYTYAVLVEEAKLSR